MRFHSIPALAAVLASTLLPAQAAAPDAAMAHTVRDPQLIASKTDWPAEGKCGKRHFEWARLSLDVMEDGSMQHVELIDASKPDVIPISMEAVREDRFSSGEQDGKRMKMHGDILVEMNACAGKVKLADGKKAEQFWLDAAPTQTFYPSPDVFIGPPDAYRIGKRISAPIPTVQPEAKFTRQARKDRVQGQVTVMLIVDANGMPQNLRVVKPLPAGLTEEALAAVRQYRFRPALKDGTTPVPVMITIVVNFRLY
jgi:TonB family protein